MLDRVRICLSRLLSHVDTESVALTGSAAVVAIAPLSSYRTTVDDVDLVASSLDALRATVASEFLVSHFHTGSPKFMVQLVCERCETSRTPEFPFAPKQTIFDLLGYV